MTLTKSEYMLYLRHPAWLWLKKQQKHVLPATAEGTQDLFDAGHEFETYAEKLFPNAVKLGFNNYEEYQHLPEKTLLAIGEDTIGAVLQGRLESNNLTCIFDVLERVSGNTFDLIEIKSSTHAKPEHEYDLAFQTVVLEDSGIEIRNVSIIHVNNNYVRIGEIDPIQITTKVDVTNAVKSLVEETREQISIALQVMDNKEMPDLSPRFANQLGVPKTTWFAEWIEIYKQLNPNLDKYSIYSMSCPNAKQIAQLEDAGIQLIKDIPEELSLRAKQAKQIQTTRDNVRIVDKEKIKEFLNTFEYPLYFFDYETLSSVIPAFDGFQPYKDYPFQYSLHIIDSPDSEVRHEEYIHDSNSNPMPGLIEKMKRDLGSHGTILAWNMAYEKGCNKTMAAFYPEHKDFLEGINERFKDLMIPFSEMWFVDKDFFGSASVKHVLPALIPELSYKDLDVSDGLKARRIWTQTVLEGKYQDQREKIMMDLSEYCTLDTFAMVKILEKLKKEIQ
jgi:hypothetical protein